MAAWIWDGIEAGSRITFSAFMEKALYHPQYGYYSHQATKIGAKGDFYTSPHLSSAFGECIARQLLECWQILGSPDRFDLVEMGAGQGILAADILQAILQISPDFFTAIQYRIIERSKTLQQVQRHHFQHHFLGSYLEANPNLITWCDWQDLPSNSVQGCFISNELVDAFPVHQVIWQDQELQEIFVRWDGTQIIEEIAPLSTPELQNYFDRLSLDFTNYPNGYRTEVNLNSISWIQTLADRLQRGYVLTIDYGYHSDRYYSPRRREGTLQCYYQHQLVSDPYTNIGFQDITAHVDFTTLIDEGMKSGLITLGQTQQSFFLMLLGLGDRIAALSQTETQNIQEINDRLQMREALHRLINPMGLGNFMVLMQSKKLTDSQQQRSLQGFTAPN